MSNDKPYKTDRFGSPDDRDYHYRIPLNDDRGMRLATWALHEIVHYKDRFVVEWDGYSGDKLSYMGIKTHDSKGHLKGLAEYAHSPKWQNLGVMSDINEYRQNPKGSGSQVKGTFRVDPQSFNGIQRLSFKTVVSATPTKLESAYEQRGDTWDEIQDSIHWAKQDAMESAREQIADKQRNCSHDMAVFPDNFISEYGSHAAGYCENCGGEITEDKELAY